MGDIIMPTLDMMNAIFSNQRLEIEEHDISSTKWVSEGLKDEVNKWNLSSHYKGVYDKKSILITAPTGSGKSTFALKELPKYLDVMFQFHNEADEGILTPAEPTAIPAQASGSVLVLSNRSALNMQQKDILFKSIKMPAVSSNSLNDINVFGNVILMTYQEALSKIRYLCDYIISANHIPEIKCIVMDEVHFFVSDATFNAKTKPILDSIFWTFPDAGRIYITATPEEVEPLIAYEEYMFAFQNAYRLSIDPYTGHRTESDFQLRTDAKKRKLIKYTFHASYDYIMLSFFSKWETIQSLIKEADPSEKWLIFVSSKEDGKKLKDDLGPLADYIDADTKSEVPQKLHSIVRMERFSARVLICTSVLDSGFNIKDPDVKHIVIDTLSSVQARQMLGRKRIDKGETISLHIRQRSREDILWIYSNAKYMLSEMQDYESNPAYYLNNNWGMLSTNFQKAFFINAMADLNNAYNCNVYLSLNPYYGYKFSIDAGNYEKILDAMKKDDDAFPKIVCSWFGKKFDPAMKQEQDDFDKEIEADFFQQNKEAIDRFLCENGLLENKGEMIFDLNGMLELNERLKNLKDSLKGNEAKKLIRYEKKNTSRVVASVNALFVYNGLSYKLEKKDNIWRVVPKE